MENLTRLFEDSYQPVAIILFRNELKEDFYTEICDIDESGKAINAHPLSAGEAAALSGLLDSHGDTTRSFWTPAGLLPGNVLYIRPESDGFVVWHTKSGQRQLYFSEELGIPNGKANVPALLWKANKNELSVFALKGSRKPRLETNLFYAPFFNLYRSGKVCMGTVDIDEKKKSLEQFIADWENYFFNSYFVHLINNHNPVKGNIVRLWQRQVSEKTLFPEDCLLSTGLTLKKLIE